MNSMKSAGRSLTYGERDRGDSRQKLKISGIYLLLVLFVKKEELTLA